MTNQELELRLRDWYAVEIGPSEAAPPALYQTLAALNEAGPLGARWHRRMLLLAAAALVVAIAAGAAVVGSGLVTLPQQLPLIPPPQVVAPSPEPSPTSATSSPSATPEPSAVTGGPSPWIVFHRDGADGLPDTSDRLWAMRADGSGAHEIQAGSFLTAGWSRDGTRLLVNNGHILVAEVGEEIGPFVDIGVAVPEAEQWEAFDFAPDRERVVFVRDTKCRAGSSSDRFASTGVVLAVFTAETPGANCNVLSVLDLRTGELTDLSETLVSDTTGDPPGSLELPAWSPDGTTIAYTRVAQTPGAGGSRELWVTNADGTDASRVELAADVSVQEPRWSPDGTRISFMSETQLSSAVYIAEIASGRMGRLTTGSDAVDGQLCCAEWIDDSHLRVGVRSDLDRFWRVAVDAPQESRLLVDLTDSLTDLGAPGVSGMRSAPGDPGRTFFWQPAGETQP